MVAYFLAPLPNLICARCNRGYESTYGQYAESLLSLPKTLLRGFKNVGFFLTGFLIVSGFALPGLLAHINMVDLLSFLLSHIRS